MSSTDRTPHHEGSGSVAIKMIHTDSKWTVAADTVRLIFSISLLIFSAVSVIYAIQTNSTTVPSTIPSWAQYLGLGISLFILGVLEGLQIAVVELAHKDPQQYKDVHPRAAKLLAFENKGRNVERFLMGRQVLVVFTVFVAARITTFDGFWWSEAPQSLVHGLMYSGFLGVILVVIVAQLTPQVLASAYPVEFLNLYGMSIAFCACLVVETTGLVHAVWFLCAMVRRLVYKCVCAKSHYEEGFDEVPTRSNYSITPLSMKAMDENGAGATRAENDIIDMVTTAKQAEIDIEEEIEYNKEYLTNDGDHIGDQLHALIHDVGHNRDLFYIYGDNKYMSPSQCYDKFKNAGLTPPQFLLPPDDKHHIPPHIVAMTLLKMYTEQARLNRDIDREDGDDI